jgi:hypothetical protein
MDKKLKVMYVVSEYPQMSQTYIKNEIEALMPFCEIEIVSLASPDVFYQNHQPYTHVFNFKEIVSRVKNFRPDVLHTHWLNMASVLHELSVKTGVPYTIRAHSFDVLGKGDKYASIRALINSMRKRPLFRGFSPNIVSHLVNADNCLGVLAFPFARPLLISAGCQDSKIVDCFPVVAYKKFLNKEPNGSGVMNVGACIPKKKMENFIDLAAMVPNRAFSLYSIGFLTPKISVYNELHGKPVRILDVLEPDLMPAEYKKNQWLVYTADPDFNTVGWPVAIAEAQAAGVGVCFPNLRSDLNDYIGGAGILYDSIEDLPDIIRNDVPKTIRDLGFENAKKSDIETHINKLMMLWGLR